MFQVDDPEEEPFKSKYAGRVLLESVLQEVSVMQEFETVIIYCYTPNYCMGDHAQFSPRLHTETLFI